MFDKTATNLVILSMSQDPMSGSLECCNTCAQVLHGKCFCHVATASVCQNPCSKRNAACSSCNSWHVPMQCFEQWKLLGMSRTSSMPCCVTNVAKSLVVSALIPSLSRTCASTWSKTSASQSQVMDETQHWDCVPAWVLPPQPASPQWSAISVTFSMLTRLRSASLLSSTDPSSPWLIRGMHSASKPPPKKDNILHFLLHGNWCTCARIPNQLLKWPPTIVQVLWVFNVTFRCHHEGPQCTIFMSETIWCALELFFQFTPHKMSLIGHWQCQFHTNQLNNLSLAQSPTSLQQRDLWLLIWQTDCLVSGMELGWSIPCPLQQTVRLVNVWTWIHSNPSESNVVTICTPCKNSLSEGIASNSAAEPIHVCQVLFLTQLLIQDCGVLGREDRVVHVQADCASMHGGKWKLQMHWWSHMLPGSSLSGLRTNSQHLNPSTLEFFHQWPMNLSIQTDCQTTGKCDWLEVFEALNDTLCWNEVWLVQKSRWFHVRELCKNCPISRENLHCHISSQTLTWTESHHNVANGQTISACATVFCSDQRIECDSHWPAWNVHKRIINFY